MYNVTFFEKKNLILCQLLNNVPSEGTVLKIKGEKGQVMSVEKLDENKFHVEIGFIKENTKKK